MLRRWARGMLVTVIVGLVVTAAVAPAAAPMAALLNPAWLSADFGAVRVELKL